MTPDGVLYDKQHILQCLLHQKKDIARKSKLWEEQNLKDGEKAAFQAGAHTRPLLSST